MCGEKKINTLIMPGKVSSRQYVQIPCQIEPKSANSSPWQRKCHSNSLPGCPGEEKSGFQTRGILASPCPAMTFPAKGCLGEKRQALAHTTHK